MKKSSGLEKLELQVSNLIAERDALAVLSEKYKESFTVLSRAYATANAQVTQALDLSESLTLQYRDIARDRAESITSLLHGNQLVDASNPTGHGATGEHARAAKLEAIIVKREQKLKAGVSNPSFNAARFLTGFVDGKFLGINPSSLSNTDYEGRLEYLSILDKEIARLMSSRAYLLRAKLAAMAGKSTKSQTGQSK